jgi:hypothetical protein
MAVRVVGPDRDDGDRRSYSGDEGQARRGPTAVMSDLDDVDRAVALDERRVDVVLGVAGSAGSTGSDRAEARSTSC